MVCDSGNFGALELGDEALEEVRRQFRRFVEAEVAPHAHGWHLRDELIPLPVVDKMAELGVFGLTVPEDMKQLKQYTRVPEDGSRPLVSAFEVRGRELVLYWRDLAPGQKIEVGIALADPQGRPTIFQKLPKNLPRLVSVRQRLPER